MGEGMSNGRPETQRGLSVLRLIVPLFLALVLPWGLVFSVNTLPPVGLVDSTQEHPIHCNRACSSYPVGGPRAAARHWLNTQQMNRLMSTVRAHFDTHLKDSETGQAYLDSDDSLELAGRGKAEWDAR